VSEMVGADASKGLFEAHLRYCGRRSRRTVGRIRRHGPLSLQHLRVEDRHIGQVDVVT
jgi:hypothetical protein